ncbi:hypothetical protein HPP92_005404 [Vanilla planifolia]|uniref:Uncharacterized protein n=1 Tax=Vanilla planifolia TaxID=51239 RepID=A0A835VEU8_VANPL|nr:hypothetical protein HPP92_005404 [Vanilla planifolia]
MATSYSLISLSLRPCEGETSPLISVAEDASSVISLEASGSYRNLLVEKENFSLEKLEVTIWTEVGPNYGS